MWAFGIAQISRQGSSLSTCLAFCRVRRCAGWWLLAIRLLNQMVPLYLIHCHPCQCSVHLLLFAVLLHMLGNMLVVGGRTQCLGTHLSKVTIVLCCLNQLASAFVVVLLVRRLSCVHLLLLLSGKVLATASAVGKVPCCCVGKMPCETCCC